MRRNLARATAVAVLIGAAVTAPATSATADVVDAANCKLAAPPSNVHNEHEAETDYNRWLRPIGTLRAQVLYVQFPAGDGSPAAWGTQAEIENRRTKFAEAAEWFRGSSYDRVNLEVRHHGWVTMRHPQSHYAGGETRYNNDYPKMQAYMQEAVSNADANIDFRGVHLLFVVPAQSATMFPTSPAMIANGDYWGVTAEGGAVVMRHGSAMGQDLDFEQWKFKVINHEVGHTFGLPDLYRYRVGPHDKGEDEHHGVGGWDLMGDIGGSANDYLAWHKWKLGWLDNWQIKCVNARGKHEFKLTPLGLKADGPKAVVVKDPNRPHRALVVENRAAVGPIDKPSPCFAPGLLVYVVDSSVGGGNGSPRPAQVIDRNPGKLCSWYHEMDNAAMSGGSMTVDDVTINFVRAEGDDRVVEIDWK